MKKYIILAVILVLVIGVSVISETREASKTQFVLNTVSTITVKGNHDKTVDLAFDRVEEIESRMTSHSATSDIATGKLNFDTTYVILKAMEYSKTSGGSFDITIKPICDLWDINGDNPRVPSREEIDNALQYVDYRKIAINDGKLALPEGMALELGAIAKGYAADEACRIIREGGIKDGIIDLGGNIVALGTKTVGVRNPLSKNDGDYFGTLKITDCAVATSGGYERFFEQDGVTYHHIFDPNTGYPVETDILSATVISEKSIDADCWSTILFSAGTQKAEQYIMEHGLQAIIVDKDSNVYIYGNAHFTLEESSNMNIVKKTICTSKSFF